MLQHDWKWDIVRAQSCKHIQSPSEYYLNKLSLDLVPIVLLL